ncbi:MAG: hypothetical protein IPQ23_22365 [Cytophagaceae bacterium]|nr:hypothetical protein [Cytophagaceae bacterium]
MTLTTRNDAVRYVEERLGADGSRALAEVFCAITRWPDQLSDAEWNDVLNDAILREADGEPFDDEATLADESATRATNAVWSSTSARSEIRVWADGGCIWAQRPADPTVAEQATYEATDHDDNGLECAWRVIVNGKVDGSLRFEAR